MKRYLSKIGSKFKEWISKSRDRIIDSVGKLLKKIKAKIKKLGYKFKIHFEKRKKFYFNFFGLFVFLILLVPHILQEHFKVEIDCQYLKSVVDIIITLIPMIFTIVAISLSLPSEKIYGVTHIQFRRLRKCSFSFLTMIFITIIIFALYTIFKILGMVLYIWALDAISLIYSVWFVSQEIPILTKNDKTIIRIIKKAWIKRENNFGQPLNEDLVYLVQNVITEKGITQTYKLFKVRGEKKEEKASAETEGKKKIKGKNTEILDSLLSIYNEYFFELSDKINIIKGSSADSFKNITIIEAVDKAFSNLEDLLTFNKDFDIVKIYGNSKEYYHLTRMMFNLKTLTDTYDSTLIFKTGMNKLLSRMFFILNYQNRDDGRQSVVLAILNAMISTTVSEDNLWFVELLRDYQYNTLLCLHGEYDGCYYYFLSMYLYYLSEYDKSVPEDFRRRIMVFLDEKGDGLNADGSNWKQIFQHQIQVCHCSKIIALLPKLLKVLKEGVFSWYQSKYRNWGACGFSKTFVIRCWLELLLHNGNRYQFDEKEFYRIIEVLNETDKAELAGEINKHWLDNNKNTVDIQIKEKSILDFYKVSNDYSIDDDETIIKTLKEARTIINFKGLQEELGKAKHDEEYDMRLKNKIIEGFKNARELVSIYDAEINLDNEEFRCYDLFFDTRWDDAFIDSYIKQFPNDFNMLVYRAIKENGRIKKKIINNTDTPDKIKRSLSYYQFKSGNEYLLHQLFSGSDVLTYLRNMEKIDLPLPYLVLLNEKAIGLNLICDEEKSFVRKLNSNEINQIIDRDFKVINGLYKYCESRDDSRTMFITREQIFDLIEKKYYYAQIVFKYKVEFDYNNVLVMMLAEDGDEDEIDSQDGI